MYVDEDMPCNKPIREQLKIVIFLNILEMLTV